MENEGNLEPPRDGWAVFETLAALGVAFIATLIVSLVAFVALAIIFEGGEIGTLMQREYALTLALEGEGDLPAAIAEIQRALPEAQAVGFRSEGGATLLAWPPAQPSEQLLAELSVALVDVGWQPGEPEVNPQSAIERSFQQPSQMKRYLPFLMTIQSVLFIGVAMLMLWWRKPAPVNPEQMSIEATIGWALLSAVGAFLTSSVLGLLFHVLGLGIEEQPWIQALFADRSALYIVLPWLVVIGPLAEEVFFRGYMFRRLLDSSGIGVAYAMTAITFGIIHFNFQAIPIYAAVALWFAFVQWRTGRLLAAIIGHMVYNGIVMAVGLFAGGAV